MTLENIINNIKYLTQSKKLVDEESTKNYLIYPFFAFLGYSMSSPLEVQYEVVCDMHENGSRRVDCIILDYNKKPLILIEAKSLGLKLENYFGQIKSYFISSKASLAIITDGNRYEVFEATQIDNSFSDCLPKYSFALTELKNEDNEIIKKLLKYNLKPFFQETENSESLINNPKIQTKEITKIEQEISYDEAIVDFFNTHQEIIGKSTALLYNMFLEDKKINSISNGKFENLSVSLYGLSICSRFGVKYLVFANTQTKIIHNFLSDFSIEILNERQCKEVYDLFLDYCKKNDWYATTYKNFCLETTTFFSFLSVKPIKKNGIFIDCFLIKNDNKNDIQLEHLTKEEKIFIKYCSELDINTIVGRPTKEVYLEYCSYCQKNNNPFYSHIAFSRYITKKTGLQIILKSMNGIKYRVFWE